MLDTKYFVEIKDLVHQLVVMNYSGLEKDGRSGRLSAAELQQVIIDYGRELIDIKSEAFNLADVYKINNKVNQWAIDLPLWTKEEGRSDLTLSVNLRVADEKIYITIQDLHVL